MTDMERKLAEIAARWGVTVDFHAEAGSTNDLARDPRYGHGDLVVAGAQTAGRGQQGNRWESEPGKNLTFSVVLQPSFLPAGAQFCLLQAASLAVIDALRTLGSDPRIKWPNDIYLGDRKTAGLLIENDVCGANLTRSIVGIGLNVNQTAFPDWIPNPTSPAVDRGREIDRGALLEALYDALMARYDTLGAGRADALGRDYHAVLYRLDAPHDFRLPGGAVFRGIIRRVAPSGELFVEHLPGSELRTYLFKEIEFL